MYAESSDEEAQLHEEPVQTLRYSVAEEAGVCMSVHSLQPSNARGRVPFGSAVFDGHVSANPMSDVLVVGVVRRAQKEHSAGFEFWSLSGLLQRATRQRAEGLVPREGSVPRLAVLCARALYAMHLVDWHFKRKRVPRYAQHWLPFTDAGGVRDDFLPQS